MVYQAAGMDIWDGCTELKNGDKVQVIKASHGCPPNGTMGHCYVGETKTGKFIGLVLINSLQKIGV